MSAARPVLLPTAIWDRMLATAAVRGKDGIEGFFRSTRPHPRMPGRFLHEHGMIRRDPVGLLRLAMGSANSVVGWMIPLHGHLYCITANVNSGTLLFEIFHGIGTSRADVFDGLILIPGASQGYSPTATAMLCERVGELSGDRDADDKRFAEFASQIPWRRKDRSRNTSGNIWRAISDRNSSRAAATGF